MRERIARHRTRRGSAWLDRETPLELAATLVETDGHGPRLVDCLTLWLSNLMHAERDWETEAALLSETLGHQKSPVVLVTNEVGLGIVPDNALARRFRDAAGILNQMVARVADQVEFVVSGLPMRVK
jgi:adenosylcobinamide kinase/adenosylcobinamide-phosphate guanylyltransferase